MIGVCIVTYNQEQYIAQAIESVLMQEPCGHEVVAYVGNDCSTDGTGVICDEYSQRVRELGNERISVKVIHNKKNLGLVGNTMNLLDIMRKDGCEYIAMLDGDDYWYDDNKLQKQMAYMEAHPEFGLVHTCIDLQYPNKLVRDKRTSMPEGDVSSMVFDYKIGNCSVVFKTELLNHIDFEDFMNQGFMSCDYIMYIIFSCYTQFGFLPDHTAVWRRGHDSVSNTNDMEKQIRYIHNGMAMWRYSAKLFPDIFTANEKEIENWYHLSAFSIAFRYGNQSYALNELQYMSDDDKRSNRLKIIAAHSRWIMSLWNRIRRWKNDD